MVFNATFNIISAISWKSVLLMQEIAVPGPIGILIVISMHAVYYLHSTCVSFCSNHFLRGRRGRDRMVVGFTTTCAISIYEH
jgi:hypothetical protein